MLRKFLLSLVVALYAGNFAHAQNFPKPGPEHAKLKELVGEWDAVITASGQESKGSATYKSICDGMWIASEFSGALGELKFTGHGIDGYDLQKKKYVGVWVDSLSSSPMQFAGNIDEKSKLLVMTGEGVNMEGKVEKVKTTTEFKTKDNFIFKLYMIDDGREDLAFTIEYTRKK